jgi:hypothetical protein
MRTVNISNEKKRNAQVGFEVTKPKSDIVMAREDGKSYTNVRLLKSTLDTEPEVILNEKGTIENVADEILKGDPEIDFEKVGMLLDGVKKVFLTQGDKIAYRINREEVVHNVDGTEKEVKPYADSPANVNDNDFPIRWTGKLIPKVEAIRRFVFKRKYQIKHVNGLTYDFLYEMAKELSDKKAMLLVGGGQKGAGPLIFSNGGTPYRAFLEGRIDGNKYCLILHLTNLELKAL